MIPSNAASPSAPLTKELKPCPFCGGEAAFGTVRYSDKTIAEQNWGQDTFHYVNCIVCGANNRGLVGHRTAEKAAEAWNRRESLAPQSLEAEEIDALKAGATALQEVGLRLIYEEGKTYSRFQCDEMARSLRSLASRLSKGDL